jgi:hypothetical protein
MADTDGDAAELAALELEALEATYAGGPLDFGSADCWASGGGRGDPPPFFSVVRADYPPVVGVHLTPRGADKGSTFVEAMLTLTTPPGYPAATAGPVAVSLSAVRGLGDSRAAALAAALRAEAAAAAGDAALGTLIEVGLDGLTAMNAPEPGTACGLCLDALVPSVEGCSSGGSGGGGPAGLGPAGGPPKGLLKLACYHCLHLCVGLLS